MLGDNLHALVFIPTDPNSIPRSVRTPLGLLEGGFRWAPSNLGQALPG